MSSYKMASTLVLSGCSTSAVNMMGAIQWLEDNNMLSGIQNYFGTSSGAILNALFCVGFTPLKLLMYLCTENPYERIKDSFNFSNILLFGNAMLPFEPLGIELKKIFVEKMGFVPTLRQLENYRQKKFYCVTYDLIKDEKVILSGTDYPDMSIIDALHASSCFPLVFQPFAYEDKVFIDGGITDNFPWEIAREMYGRDRCVGVHVASKQIPYDKDMGLFEFTKKILRTFILQITSAKSKDPGIYQLQNQEISFFDFSSTHKEFLEKFDSGYAAIKLCESTKKCPVLFA